MRTWSPCAGPGRAQTRQPRPRTPPGLQWFRERAPRPFPDAVPPFRFPSPACDAWREGCWPQRTPWISRCPPRRWPAWQPPPETPPGPASAYELRVTGLAPTTLPPTSQHRTGTRAGARLLAPQVAMHGHFARQHGSQGPQRQRVALRVRGAVLRAIRPAPRCEEQGLVHRGDRSRLQRGLAEAVVRHRRAHDVQRPRHVPALAAKGRGRAAPHARPLPLAAGQARQATHEFPCKRRVPGGARVQRPIAAQGRLGDAPRQVRRSLAPVRRRQESEGQAAAPPPGAPREQLGRVAFAQQPRRGHGRVRPRPGRQLHQTRQHGAPLRLRHLWQLGLARRRRLPPPLPRGPLDLRSGASTITGAFASPGKVRRRGTLSGEKHTRGEPCALRTSAAGAACPAGRCASRVLNSVAAAASATSGVTAGPRRFPRPLPLARLCATARQRATPASSLSRSRATRRSKSPSSLPGKKVGATSSNTLVAQGSASRQESRSSTAGKGVGPGVTGESVTAMPCHCCRSGRHSARA